MKLSDNSNNGGRMNGNRYLSFPQNANVFSCIYISCISEYFEMSSCFGKQTIGIF